MEGCAMGQVLQGCATTTEAVRRAIRNSQESMRPLSRRHGINPKTVAKWKKRVSVADLPTGPKEPKSTSLALEDEAIIVAFRKYTLLSLDDCLYALQANIPHLTRSSLHRCLQRHGISRLPDVEDGKGIKRKFKTYPIGYFHIDIAEVRHRPDIKVCLHRVARESHETRRSQFPAEPHQGGALQGPHRPHRQWHPLYRPRRRELECDRDKGHDRTQATLLGPCFRAGLRAQRHRSPPHQAQASLDER